MVNSVFVSARAAPLRGILAAVFLLSCSAPTAEESHSPIDVIIDVGTSDSASDAPDIAVAPNVPDTSQAVAVRKYINPWQDGDSVAEPWPSVANTVGLRILTGTVVSIAEPVPTLWPAVDIESECPGAYYGEPFVRVRVLPDGVIDESLYGPGDEACGWSPANDDGTLDLWYRTGITDLYTSDFKPHPACTFSYQAESPPDSFGLSSGLQLLILTRPIHVRVEMLDVWPTDEPIVPYRYGLASAGPVDDQPFESGGVELSVEDVVKKLAEGQAWVHGRANCDFILAGSPEGKGWEDYLPDQAKDAPDSTQ
ncbi:MAG: hypothetical protein IV100_29670 [Myxococcales bacterium]|nr:hypothetical protein [Myxococcales bacterium]